ncbi:phage tail protein [Herbaspirillum sp. 1130]|uniref:phage tail protein n=1 Tax=Herbaspirillum sp. 1130 TaxID=2806562 RepID=UPI001AEB7CFE|nr:phage tail protein [Herbaspirillum sp. 1130]MBP1314537.1 phage-related protein [Herbaspirillum sp. 1130]
MTIETFSWQQSGARTRQAKFSLRTVGFGDGYEQVGVAGLNPVQDTWTVSVSGPEPLIAEVEEFLDRNGGAGKAFYWTAPRKGQVLVRVSEGGYSTADAGGGVSTVTVTFKRANTP